MIGEFELIERFRKQIKTDSSVIKGSGDDCAVLKFDKKRYQLFTCDMIVEGVDFTLKDDPYLIGRKAVAISLSDIAACSGLPSSCVAAISIPKKLSLSFLDRIFKGMLDISKEFKLNICGGDISKGRELAIDVSMLGLVERKALTLRSGALPGDMVFVTGTLGGSIKGKHFSFCPRIQEARFLSRNFKVHSMIDISDGLAQDLGHILKQSRVGAVIYEDLIPQAPESRGLSDALYAGEDFELLFTLSRQEASRLLKRKMINFKPIGEILPKAYGMRLVDANGRDLPLSAKGYRHF